MTEPIIINENKCDYFQSYREENNWDISIDTDWCAENDCKCSDVPFNKCLVKAIEYCKIKEKQLKRKEQECEELKSKIQKIENNCIEIFNFFSELGEKYKKLKGECEKYKNCIDEIKEALDILK